MAVGEREGRGVRQLDDEWLVVRRVSVSVDDCACMGLSSVSAEPTSEC